MSRNDAIYEEEYKGLNIYIIPDDDPQASDPMDWDNLGKQVYWHRRMNLGHCWKETNKYSPMEWLEREINDDDVYEEWQEKHSRRLEYQDYLMELFMKNNLVIPVSAYEHGGITISASGHRAGWDSFDSGQLGFVYVSHEDIKKEFNVGRLTKKILERAEKILRDEVSNYDDYLTGQVYGFVIENQHEEELDSCWGFLGDYKYCLENAKSQADFFAREIEEKEWNAVPMSIQE